MNKINDILESFLRYADSPTPLNNIQFAMNQMNSAISNRIFNSEVGVKDINGVGTNGYTKKYKIIRGKYGRQKLKKDFNLTDKLAKSLQLKVVEKSGKSILTIYINGKRNKELADKLTEQTAKRHGTGKIFVASKRELDEMNRVIQLLIESDLKEIYEQFSG